MSRFLGKVMVVDDNPINRIVTRRLLDTIGCKSTVLDSGQKCLDVLEEKGPLEFQVILLDLCMPEVHHSNFPIPNSRVDFSKLVVQPIDEWGTWSNYVFHLVFSTNSNSSRIETQNGKQ